MIQSLITILSLRHLHIDYLTPSSANLAPILDAPMNDTTTHDLPIVQIISRVQRAAATTPASVIFQRLNNYFDIFARNSALTNALWEDGHARGYEDVV